MIASKTKEASDYININYPGLLLVSQSILQQNYAFKPNSQVLSSNPLKCKQLFEAEQNILQQRVIMNQSYARSLKDLCLRVLSFMRLESDSLYNNEEIFKRQQSSNRDLSGLFQGIKMLIEITSSNRNIDSKNLFKKLVQNDITEMNKKMQQIQILTKQSIDCVLKFTYDIPNKIVTKQDSSQFANFNYNQMYLNFINFLQTKIVLLQKQLDEFSQAESREHVYGSNINPNDPSAVKYIQNANEIRAQILEIQSFFLENESLLVLAQMFILDEQKKLIQYCYDELNKFEHIVIEINENTMNLLFLNFIRYNDLKQIKNTLDKKLNELQSKLVIPISSSENKDTIDKSQVQLTAVEELLLRRREQLKQCKDQFRYGFFRLLFNKKYIKAVQELKQLRAQSFETKEKLEYIVLLRVLEIKILSQSEQIKVFIAEVTQAIQEGHLKNQQNPELFKNYFLKCSEYLTMFHNVCDQLDEYNQIPDISQFSEKYSSRIQNSYFLIDKLDQIQIELVVFLQKGVSKFELQVEEFIKDIKQLCKDGVQKLDSRLLDNISKSLIENEDVDNYVVFIANNLKLAQTKFKEVFAYLQDEVKCSQHSKEKLQDHIQNLERLIKNYSALVLCTEKRPLMNERILDRLMQDQIKKYNQVISSDEKGIQNGVDIKSFNKILDTHIIQMETQQRKSSTQLSDQSRKIFKETIEFYTLIYQILEFIDQSYEQVVIFQKTLNESQYKDKIVIFEDNKDRYVNVLQQIHNMYERIQNLLPQCEVQFTDINQKAKYVKYINENLKLIEQKLDHNYTMTMVEQLNRNVQITSAFYSYKRMRYIDNIQNFVQPNSQLAQNNPQFQIKFINQKDLIQKFEELKAEYDISKTECETSQNELMQVRIPSLQNDQIDKIKFQTQEAENYSEILKGTMNLIEELKQIPVIDHDILKTKEKDFKGKYQFDKEKNEFTNNVAIFIVKIFTPLN